MSKSRVIICGAGWAGLNAGRLLKSNGYEVIILEKSDRVGGRVTSDLVDGFILDRGFQVINPAYAELRETNIISHLDFRSLPKGIDLRVDLNTVRVGDFRKNLSYIRGDLDRQTGTLSEKFAFLSYLRSKTEDVELGSALSKCGDFFDRVLKPFLDGVFLFDSNRVSNRMARELIHWFLKGDPGVPNGGVAQASESLAAGLDVRLGVEVTEVSPRKVVTSHGEELADAVILACDPRTSSRLLRIPEPRMNASATWYFALPVGEINSNHLRVGGVGPVVNSIVISNVARGYAPNGRALLAATSITSTTESEVRAHLSYLWDANPRDWELITKCEIPESLPFHGVGKELIASSAQEHGIYLAGDWRSTPSQQGALVSGRLAASAVISDR